MKRQERHHLKENELVHTLETTRDFIETRKRQIGMVVTAVLVIAVVGIGAPRCTDSEVNRGVSSCWLTRW